MSYNDKVMDHFLNPRNMGEIADADGVGEVGNPKCGDIMRMYLKVRDGKVIDVKFKTFGCAAAIATSSVATELIKGKDISYAAKVSNKDVLNFLGELPAPKIHCSLLAEQCIRAAIVDYYKRSGLDDLTIENLIKN